SAMAVVPHEGARIGKRWGPWRVAFGERALRQRVEAVVGPHFDIYEQTGAGQDRRRGAQQRMKEQDFAVLREMRNRTGAPHQHVQARQCESSRHDVVEANQFEHVAAERDIQLAVVMTITRNPPRYGSIANCSPVGTSNGVRGGSAMSVSSGEK